MCNENFLCDLRIESGLRAALGHIGNVIINCMWYSQRICPETSDRSGENPAESAALSEILGDEVTGVGAVSPACS